MARRNLTTTSYAVLAHLAVRSWPTYELVQQMTRGLDLVWPRAERAMYSEPKNLVAHGYAKARTERYGRRTRTVYEITPAGRRALAAWLETPAGLPQLESEPLVRVFFGEHGSRDALLRAIDACAAHAEEIRDRLLRQIAGYLSEGGPYPDRWPVIAVGSRYLLEYAATMQRWASWASDEVLSWPSSEPGRDRGAHLLEENVRNAAQRRGARRPR